MTKNNLLLTIDWQQFKPQNLQQLLQAEKERIINSIQQLLAKANPTIDDLFGEESLQEAILSEQHFNPMMHLSGVDDNPEYREAFMALMDEMNEMSFLFFTPEVYQVIQQIAQAPQATSYTQEQKRALDKLLLAFQHKGINLGAEEKQKFQQLSQELQKATYQYSQNCLDSTQAWYKLITDPVELVGLTTDNLSFLADLAQSRELQGFLVTLDPPVMEIILENCENRDLRRQVYQAYHRVASPLSGEGQWDNTELADKIYNLMLEQAQLLGYKTIAEFELSTKVASSATEVLDFLGKLAQKAKPDALAYAQALKDYALAKDGLKDFQAWDLPYYKNLYNKEKYSLDPEEVKKHLPEDQVRQGLFTILEKLYGVTFEYAPEVPVYHPDVKFFKVLEDGEVVAGIYMDLYVRKGKNQGAWMDVASDRQAVAGTTKLPITYIVCNFMPAINGKASLLSHEDMVTFFHEMGHALHHMLSKTSLAPLCGVSVEHDVVELPSQFHENFCFDPQSLALCTRHTDTGEPMPPQMIKRLITKYRKANHNTSLLINQCSYASFDMALFSRDASDKRSVREVYLETRKDFVIYPEFNNEGYFPNQFSHIFAGGYTAGYYAYLWAEVLAADAFQAFKEAPSLFSKEVSYAFRDHILAVGSTYPFMETYRRFRGQDPELNPLLVSYGCEG